VLSVYRLSEFWRSLVVKRSNEKYRFFSTGPALWTTFSQKSANEGAGVLAQ